MPHEVTSSQAHQCPIQIRLSPGFTLIELLVVILMLVLLIATMLPVRGTGSCFTDRVFADMNDPNSGLGFYHSGRSSNAMFADGYAETHTITLINEVSLDCGTRC